MPGGGSAWKGDMEWYIHLAPTPWTAAEHAPTFRAMRRKIFRGVVGVGAMILASGCITQEGAEGVVAAFTSKEMPDSLPAMLNESPPFLYPVDLYSAKVQGNVTLRLFVDTAGALVPESTSVVTSSGYPGLDSAAIKGSERLRFAPAKKGPKPMAMPVLLPVFFRHPEGTALPGDSVLGPRVP